MLVFSTTSERALCSGVDVTEELDHAGGVLRMKSFSRFLTSLEAFPVPTIAVCVGNCVGGGAEIVAGCDLRIAGDNLKLAWAGARLGVPVGPARLTPLVGVARAKELIFTGRTIGAEEAAAIGLVHDTVPATFAEARGAEARRARRRARSPRACTSSSRCFASSTARRVASPTRTSCSRSSSARARACRRARRGRRPAPSLRAS